MGYIAGGLLPAGRLAEQIVAARALTSGPLGVNLFVPQPTTDTPGGLAAYAKALAGEAEHYGVGLGEPHYSDDDWAAKLDLMHDLRPEVVSFTFGLPTIDECRRLKSAGIVPVATVTTVEEAQMALACGAQALVAQGPYAGGHRGTFDPVALPPREPLEDLLAALASRFDEPVVAAGGLATWTT
jgi:nitronate monooxygenase